MHVHSPPDPTSPQAQCHAHHWSLDPAVAYLNHGAFGACPQAVLDIQAEVRAALERNPMRFFTRELQPRLDRSREAVASLIGAAPGELVFVNNATAGVNAVVRSFPLARGDEVLRTSHGYNACNNALATVAQRQGASIAVADIPLPVSDEQDVIDAIVSAVTDRTQLAVIDHVTSPTALVLPLKQIVEALHERGVKVLVDGAHAPGMLPLDMQAIGADWYVGNCHKWLCAPKSTGFLYARAASQAGIDPPIISHGRNTHRPWRSPFLDDFDWPGTQDPTAMCCVADAIAWLEGLLPGGLDALQERNRAMAMQARDLLCEDTPLEPICPASMIGSMAAVRLPDDPAATPRFDPRDSITPPHVLQVLLAERHDIAVPCFYFPAFPKRMLRVSAQAYNHADDYRRLKSALLEEMALENDR